MASYTYTNSSLVEYTRISPNRNPNRNQPITKITIHHWAGKGSLETFGNIVASTARGMSANYAIDKDARVGLFCPESDRAWTSNSRVNDYAAVTIEVSNSAIGDSTGWPISDKVMAKLIDLCVDICYRNNIPSLYYKSDSSGTLTRHCDVTSKDNPTGCPGPYIKSKTQYICDQVNKKLNEKRNPKPAETKPTTSTTTTTKFKAGDLVSIKSGATYYNGKAMPSWVANDKWYIASISGDRAVLGKNLAKSSNIQSPVNTKYLTLVNTNTGTTAAVSVSYTVSLKASDIIYKTAGGATVGTVGATGTFTIVEEKTVNGVKYGKLKSGVGWVKVPTNTTSSSSNKSIKKGDKVKVINPIIYGTSKKFSVLASTYVVLSISGDRVVISSDGKNVTAAIDVKNLQKV